MKKRSILFFFIFLSSWVYSQNESLPFLQGAMGLSFGMFQDRVKEILIQKGGNFDSTISSNDAMAFSNLTLGYKKTDFVITKFVSNKLYEIDFLFSTLEAKTQELFDDIRSDVEKKYGKGECYRNFKGIYSDGDGYEMTAVKTGNAKIECYWPGFQDESTISLKIDEHLLVILCYQDGVLVKEKIKEQDKIKANEY
jgi:hypothetical protein